mmetsp:Transcript_92012/g.276116  ORF Transcript_92012/g.276116 Transcript_92012/m.276116 type:complete len:209 (+) Transcript_92012:2545-3171(+)
MVPEGGVGASKDCRPNIHEVIEITMARSVRTVVHCLRRKVPHGLAHFMRKFGCGSHGRSCQTASRKGSSVVRRQPQALPQEAMDFLSIARLEEVDLSDQLVVGKLALTVVCACQVCEPSTECMHVPPRGEVRLLILRDAGEGVLDADVCLNQIRSPNGRACWECPLQPTAQRTRHRPPIRVVLLILLLRPNFVLRMLVWRALCGIAPR